jgi:DNA-binding CsgD family transcriptional regulator/tetratricopeptide (TPR) repeat protein
LPWVDRASLEAIRFSVRRLHAQPIRILGTQSIAGRMDTVGSLPPLPDTLPTDAVERWRLSPLDGTAVERLLSDRLRSRLPRRTVQALVERSGGNPFWALQLGSELLRSGTAGPDLPVPNLLSTVVSHRLAGISRDAYEALLVVSALFDPTRTLARSALTGAVDDPAAAIDAAVVAGVVSVSASHLRPAHQLLGSTALDGLPRAARAALHQRLAEVVDEPEQHARHRALSAGDGPDAEVAAALDAGAGSAEAKGAVTTAIELVELSVRLTPDADDDARARRHLHAAELLFGSGELEAAREHATAADRTRLSSADHRRLLPILAESTMWVRGRGAAQELLRCTLDESVDDPHLHAVALALAADIGDGRSRSRVRLARNALARFAAVEGEPDPAGLMTALTSLASFRLSAGKGLDLDLLNRAEAAERKVRCPPLTRRPSLVRAWWLGVLDDLAGSRTALHTVIHRARRHEEEGVLPDLLGHLALTECWAGRYPDAIEAAEEGLHRARHSPTRTTQVLHAARGMLFALTGDLGAARAFMRARLGASTRAADDGEALHVLAVLGLVALLDGDSEHAVALLDGAMTAARRICWLDPGRRLRLEGDLGSALVNTDRLDEATALAASLRCLGQRSERPAVLGVGMRIDGLATAARGDLDCAVRLLEGAVAAHRRAQFPLELGRSLLALGQTWRRRRDRTQARRALRESFERFTVMGATPFADQARNELDRVDPARAGAALTAAESRVAQLVATGLANREVAAQLYTSVRTVEGHLGAVYRKLGVRSRTELTRMICDRGRSAPPRARQPASGVTSGVTSPGTSRAAAALTDGLHW